MIDTEEKITRWMNSYLEAFSSLDVERTLTFYRTPGLASSPAGLVDVTSPAQLREFIGQHFAQMKATGYAGSRFEALRVFALSETSAIVSAVWVRLNPGGEPLERNGWTYQLACIGGEYAIVSGIMHAADKALR